MWANRRGEVLREMRYEFLVSSAVSPTVEAAFPELSVAPAAAGGTALYGAVEDSVSLRELLRRFADLGLAVVELRRIPE